MSYGPGDFFRIMAKEYCSNNDQIRKLKSRGLIIANRTSAKRLLEYGNYFVIINGYKELFIDSTYTGPDEKYKVGTTFEEIYALYSFDKKLRALYLQNILEIENSIKSILARVFSAKYGHDNYLKINNFEVSVPHNSRQESAKRVGEIVRLISTIQSDVSQQLKKKNPMIVHYQLDYGFIPPWVLVNILTLGTVSIFFSFMYQVDQNNVGRKFGLRPHEMLSCLDILTLYRNTCAHGGRLFNFYSHKRIVRMGIHNQLGLPTAGPSGNLRCGQRDLFAVTIVFKLMEKNKAFSGFYNELSKLIDELSGQLHTIPIDDVLRSMGFPSNWKDIKRI